jgi:hypothetical protein
MHLLFCGVCSRDDVEPDSSDADEALVTDNHIFRGLTAWFSQSVRDSLRQKWGVLDECSDYEKSFTFWLILLDDDGKTDSSNFSLSGYK